MKTVRTVLALLLLAGIAFSAQPQPISNGDVQPIRTAAKTQYRLGKDEDKILKKYALDRIGHRGIGRGFNMFGPEIERQLGNDWSAQIDQQSRMIKDPELTAYLERVGRRLVDASDATDRRFRFKVVNSDEVNAMALPNGNVYVNAGLILFADNEAELASVLAHEIAHVIARHATKSASKAKLIDLGLMAATIWGGGIGQMVQPVVSVAGQGVGMKFSRDAEREADLLGLEYEYQAGYDCEAFVRLMERMAQFAPAQQSKFSKLFATHPPSEERVARAQRAIAILLPPRADYVLTTDEFLAAKQRTMSIVNPAGAREAASGPVMLRKRPTAEPQPQKTLADLEQEIDASGQQ